MRPPAAAIPNVVFICADDLNGWIGPLGRYPGVHTPHIDALAERGALFTHAYCTAPHCNPSRASVFAGQRPTTTGVYLNEQLPDREELVTLPSHFRRAGYEAFGAGKVFHGHYDYPAATREQAPAARWMDSHNDAGAWNEFHPCEDEPLPPGRPLNRFFDFSGGRQIDPWYSHFDWGPLPETMSSKLPDVRVADRVVEFLQRSHPRPFFCAVGFYRPHLPWYVPQRFFDLYPLADIRLPFVEATDLDGVPEIARLWARTPNDHELITRHGQWRHAIQGYLASISFCDELLGRLMSTLEASGLAESTTVVLWGDNGFHLGEKLHWRKFTLWEEATRVPLLIAAPGRSQAGFRFDDPVSLLDLYPTLLELTGLPPSAQLEGESLAPWLAPCDEPRRSVPISTWEVDNHSVRTADWRFTRYRDGAEELYDHRADPFERDNLADRPDLAPVRERLRAHLAGL